MPDYACLVVGANAGLIGMCKEHLGVALALKVPTFFLVTKCDDICPEHVLKVCKSVSATNKFPYTHVRLLLELALTSCLPV